MKPTMINAEAWHIRALRWHGATYTGRRNADGTANKADWRKWVEGIGDPEHLGWDNALNVLVGVTFDPADAARWTSADVSIQVEVRGHVGFVGSEVRCVWMIRGGSGPVRELPIETSPAEVAREARDLANALVKVEIERIRDMIRRDRLRLAAALRVAEILAQGGGGMVREDFPPAPVEP